MKFRVTMKDPDTLGDAIAEAVNPAPNPSMLIEKEDWKKEI